MNDKKLMDIGNLLDNCGLIVTEKDFEDGMYFAPHWHNYFEIEFITDGRATQIYNGRSYSLFRGCMYLMSYCDYHSFCVEERIKLYNIRFDKSYLNDKLFNYIIGNKNNFIHFYGEDKTVNIIAKIEELEKESCESEILSEVSKSCILSELIISLIRNSPKCDETERMPQPIQSAAQYVIKNFRDDISLKQVADYLCVSSNYLGTLFKNYLGTTFNLYLNNLRLNYSCNLLKSTQLTIKEIAFASGYSSLEHFSYIFKKNFNMSPGAYRKSNFCV